MSLLPSASWTHKFIILHLNTPASGSSVILEASYINGFGINKESILSFFVFVFFNLICLCFFKNFFPVLGIEPMALLMLGKCSISSSCH